MDDVVFSNLSMIAAIGQNYELGYNNNLIWRIREDLAFFKKTTMNSYIIMGRKTYESMPKLKNRKYIILSKSMTNVPEGSLLFQSVDQVKEFIAKLEEEAFVIGGGELYRQFINYSNIMHLTEIQRTSSVADVYFPRFEKSLWNEQRGETLIDDGISYNHVKYLRKQKEVR